VPVATLLERLGSTLRGLDAAWLRKPYHWSIVAVRRCMVQFGLISTFFDFVTFGVLWWLVSGVPELFRTGWFVESLLSETFLAGGNSRRSRRYFLPSKPRTRLARAVQACNRNEKSDPARTSRAPMPMKRSRSSGAYMPPMPGNLPCLRHAAITLV
jgi:hypothetical protein